MSEIFMIACFIVGVMLGGWIGWTLCYRWHGLAELFGKKR